MIGQVLISQPLGHGWELMAAAKSLPLLAIVAGSAVLCPVLLPVVQGMCGNSEQEGRQKGSRKIGIPNYILPSPFGWQFRSPQSDLLP